MNGEGGTSFKRIQDRANENDMEFNADYLGNQDPRPRSQLEEGSEIKEAEL